MRIQGQAIGMQRQSNHSSLCLDCQVVCFCFQWRSGVLVQSGQPKTRPDSHLQYLAVLPISFLSEQGDRLAGLYEQSAIGENYRDLFASSVWVYSLHSYLALVREKLGEEVAEAVWSRQRNMFDEAEAGAGQSMESAFMLIDAALTLPRFGMGEREAAINVPPEIRVALALLLGMPESPDFASGMDERSERVRTMQAEVEGRLACCLLHARAALLAACSNLFEHNRNGADS